jgi:opacity protein-like surface antigen
MTMIALLLALSAGDFDLPRTLASDTEFALEAPAPPAQKVDPAWSVGGHLGVASSFDSDDAAFLIGGHARVRLLPWLGAEASLDFQTPQAYESGDIDVTVFAIQVSALFYLPVDWPVKPYGVAGFGLYIVDVGYSGALGYKKDTTDVEVGFHVGVGAEYVLTPTISLDADLRFIFLTGSAAGNDFDYLQFTVGVSFKIG